MPGDPLASVDSIELAIVYGGSLGLAWEKSLFAASPHLAATLKPCLDELLKEVLSRRSVSIVPKAGGATEATGFTPGLSLRIFGRPIELSDNQGTVNTFLIELEFTQHVKATVRQEAGSDEVEELSCDEVAVYSSSYLGTVLPSETETAILGAVGSLLQKFAQNPAYCASRRSEAFPCAGFKSPIPVCHK
jgi:hypothetical protein